MQAIEWTIELIIIISGTSLVSVLLGYLLQFPKIIKLKTQLQQIKQDMALVNSQNQQYQAEIKQFDTDLHEKELNESKLQNQLNNVQATEQRLNAELTERQKELIAHNKTLEETRQQHHATEKQLESIKTENHAQNKQIEELRERLNQTNKELVQERNTANTIKKELIDEGKKAKEFEVLNQDAQKLLQETKQNWVDLQEKYTKLQEHHQSLSNEHTELKTTLEGKEEHFKKQMQQLSERLDQTNKELVQERNTANTIKKELIDEGKKAKEFEVLNQDAQKLLQETKQNWVDLQEKYTKLQEHHQSLSNEHTELKTTLDGKEEYFKEQMKQFSETKLSLTKEFENLANKIFEEKGKTFTHTSQTSIDIMLKPFREQIEGFQKRINEVHDASLQGNTSLNTEIKKVVEIGLKMSKEANNLTSALKGDAQQRGAWGEAQLRRTLEMSGLVEDTHYEVQSAFKDSEGKQKQTDYLIKLPANKHIIIDSKVALNAYDRAIAAKSDQEYLHAIKEHVKAVRKHIDDLSVKDYTNLVGMRSPNFVLMFMPIEPAYIEALKNSKDLFEYGYKKGIVLVSHTTLIPILRTVSNLWMIEHSNTEAREISEKAGDIYNQVCLVAERLSKLGGTLNTISNHYNSTVKALAGQQGLYGKVERFSQLSAKISKTLPHLEVAHLDFETERLTLIVEPVEELEVSESLALETVKSNKYQLSQQIQGTSSIEPKTAENH